MFTLSEGEFLVKLARKTIEEYFVTHKIPKPPKDAPKNLFEEAGVFVTLETFPEKHLRGCIGYPEPIKPLVEAAMDSAINAAFQDPRFPALEKEELNRIVVEVNILTPPELIRVSNPKEYPKQIEVGKHGLIVEHGFYRGLLLPIVAVEYKWSCVEFLTETCHKAGLTPDMWLDPHTKIYRFESQVFAEESPKGKIREIDLKELIARK